MRNTTIQDIADLANVSKATVSRVLNNTTTVRQDKRQAVLDATKALGFKPNVFARGLAGGRSMTIGILTQCLGSTFYDAIAQGIVAGLTDSGYSPIFGDGQWQREKQLEMIHTLKGRKVDGLVVIGGDVSGQELDEITQELPTVVVARELPGDEHLCVYVDNKDGGYRATKHLIEQGHKDIAIFRGLAHHPDAIDRHEGFNQALAEAGISADPELVVQGDFTAQSGVIGVNSLLARGKSFSAIFAANDIVAFGARLALHRHGIRVPEDVSIVGFDDQPEAAFATPPLTTVRQPAADMGATAARLILKLIAGEHCESVLLPSELKVRESVARLTRG